MKAYKNSEEFAKQLMDILGTESPSKNFVGNVMSSVRATKITNVEIRYKPLISKMGWLLIGGLTVLITLFLLNGSSDFSNIFGEVNLDIFTEVNLNVFSWLNSLEILNNIKISKLFTLSFVLFTVLVMFQLTVIKNYFNRENDLNL